MGSSLVEMADVAGPGHNGDFEEEFEGRPLIERRGGGDKNGGGGVRSEDEVERGSSRSKRKGKGLSMGPYLTRSLTELLLGSHLNVLLIFIPISIISVHILQLGPGWVFAFALAALTPLAERLGYVTEQLSQFTGPTLGGLLNATFGNATELIISIFALQNGLIRVVQMSLLGSILSNMLLVLGCAFFAGGLKYREQKFNRSAAMVNSGLLLMAVMGLVLPAVLQATHTELNGENSELLLSRFTSCLLLIAYASYLYFQLKTHTHLYDEEGGEGDEEEEEVLGFWGSVFWLGIITLFISLLSEYLVDAIEGAASSWGIPVAFISVIILPIVGNAAEHASAIMFATKDKVDISLGVAIGSSTQIAMFAIPFCVVYGWVIGVPMDLDFHVFETASLFVTVLVVATLLQEGECNYFKGIMLVLSYLIVAASFYVHNDQDPNESLLTPNDSLAPSPLTALQALLPPALAPPVAPPPT